MMDLFRAEVETHSAALNDGLLGLESNPQAKEKFQALMRAAHSIKGAARIVGIEAVVKIAHVMEDAFVAAQEARASLGSADIDVLLRALDTIGRIAGSPDASAQGWHTDHAGELQELIAAIGEMTSRPAEPSAQPQAPPPVPAAPPAGSAAPPDNVDRVVRITAENLDKLMGLAGESLVEARWLQPFSNSLMQLKKDQAQLARVLAKFRDSFDGRETDEECERSLSDAHQRAEACRQVLAARIAEFEVFARRSSNLSNRLYREVVASRMRPLSDGVQGFPRLVRDLARTLGKKVDFQIEGLATGVDRDILDRLEAPLNHLLRNAVDHAIERPGERMAACKPPEGKIRLEARHRAGMLSITLTDDGRGIDPEQIRRKIVEKRMVGADMAGDLSEAELMEFLFLPGFSTASKVTEISGRGVGLNVVQSMVQEVGGHVRATSRLGEGTTFLLQLPLTLSVIRTLLVEISGEPYAFPLARIDRSVKVPRSQVELIEGRQFFRLGEDNVALISASQVLEVAEKGGGADELSVIVLGDQMSRYGLVVDRFLGERELVLRPLDPRLGKLQDIGSAAIMVDGSPVLIVDVEDMVRSIDNLLREGRLRRVGRTQGKAAKKGRKRILVVDDSVTVREVERKLLEEGGYLVEVAVNGMDGWNAVRTAPYDLVITDVDMPRMNGIELVASIRRDPSVKNMPVMIVSYKDRDEDRSRGLEAGANFYLTKSSFEDETLLRTVVNLIGEAAPCA